MISHIVLCSRWPLRRFHWGLSTLRELLSLLLLLVHLVELGDALLGRWVLHVLLTPVASLLAWALWLPLHRVSDRWVLRLLGAVVFFFAGIFRFLRVAQLVSLPLDWSHMRLHASAWAGALFLTMATIELYSTSWTVSVLYCQYSGTSRCSETRIWPHLEVGRRWDYMLEACHT
jgi:hypothetical protein